MVSQFEETLEKGREESRAKLKIIAPNFKGDVIESGVSSVGGQVSSRSRNRSSVSAAEQQRQADRRAMAAQEEKSRIEERNRLTGEEKRRIGNDEMIKRDSGLLFQLKQPLEFISGGVEKGKEVFEAGGEVVKDVLSTPTNIPLFAGVPFGEVPIKKVKEGVPIVGGDIGGLIGGDVGRLVGGGVGEVAQIFIPETVGGAIVLSAGFQALKAAPPIARIGLDVVFTPGEIKTAFDPTVSPERRIAAGTFATLGVAGTLFEGAPFIKGAIARVDPGFSPIVDEAVDVGRLFPGGKVRVVKDISVSDISKLDDSFDIRLIEEGKGFGFTTAEHEAFIGKKATLTTSARDLFGKTDDTINIGEGEAGLGLFFTPTLGDVGEARVSRLGLETDLFKFSGLDTRIGFKRETPQIVFVRDTLITKTAKPGTARGIGFPSGELEVTLLPGQELIGARAGVTRMKGQKVELFEAFVKTTPEIFKPNDFSMQPPKINIPELDLSSKAVSSVVNPFSIGVGAQRTIDIVSTTSTRGRGRTSIVDTMAIVDFVPTRPKKDTSTIPIVDTSFFRPPSSHSRPPSSPPVRFTLGDSIVRPPTTPTRPISPLGKPALDPFLFDLGFKMTPPEIKLAKRKFIRTPSLGSVIKFQLGIEQLKLGSVLEETGLVERSFDMPQIIAPLGPIIIKSKNKNSKKKKVKK